MAIKIKKADQDKPSLPAKLDKLLVQAFSFQQISSKYEDAFKETKKEVEIYLDKNDDGFDLEEKTFKCDQGSVTYAERTSYDYDKDAIIELVNSGKVTLETLIGLATFSAEKLKVALGDTNFKKVSTEKTTNYLTLKASSDFKEECDRKFEAILPKKEDEYVPREKDEIALKEVKERNAKAKATPVKPALTEKAKADAIKKAKGAKALTKKVTTVDEDLADILGE